MISIWGEERARLWDYLHSPDIIISGLCSFALLLYVLVRRRLRSKVIPPYGLLGKTVTHPPNCADIFAIGAQLFAEPDDLDIHGPISDGIIFAVDFVHVLGPGEHPTGPPGQHAEEAEFRGG
jgi:hypothetical protein